MASIFTFGTEPLRISSPWPNKQIETANNGIAEGKSTLAGLKVPKTEILADCGISKLEAEPQEGPTEYKLHLLLRPRRSFSSTSTVQKISGSYLSKSGAPRSHSDTHVQQAKPMPLLAPSSHSRQNRLQHLTTQLLWRLQQSSPYHASSRSNLVLPMLPEADINISTSSGPRPLISGLEESNGALYEIGVSDDGTFVGLTKDELEESLTILRAMAFSLGCNVQVLRMIIVGDCQWMEEIKSKTRSAFQVHKEKLWIAEAFVAPNLASLKALSSPATLPPKRDVSPNIKRGLGNLKEDKIRSGSEQLRVSLTGSTTSGKTSLLGTLSTSTLDNGRGKSRLSLLKHRHEIVSGVTSSLAQELLGYQDTQPCKEGRGTQVINYASGNVSSWEDIHSASESCRLVFLTDSAGHPRYKRTTVRGLISWAPHWTLCCIAADDQEDNTGKVGATASAKEVLGAAGIGTDLSKAHLDLCLKLGLCLVIVITKLDLATKTGLRDTLAKVLTTLKSAGRKPLVIPSSSNENADPLLQTIGDNDEEVVRTAFASVQPNNLHSLVPIVLTSAVIGRGISRLHALLRQLPIHTCPPQVGSLIQPEYEPHAKDLFHVDEVFVMPSTNCSSKTKSSAPRSILSGLLRYGSLNLGDSMLIGPFNLEDVRGMESKRDLPRAASYPGMARGSHEGATLVHDSSGSASPALSNKEDRAEKVSRSFQTWRKVRISSLRNMRLPVQTLSPGQVGTIGIVPFESESSALINLSSSELGVRRGMVILSIPDSMILEFPMSCRRFTAVFQEAGLPAWPGVLVTVYIASIRASAKIVEVKALEPGKAADDIFVFDDEDDDNDNSSNSSTEILTSHQHTEILFEFTATREWVEIDTQVLVTPGGGPSLTGQPEQKEMGSAGLDGYVGKITQTAV